MSHYTIFKADDVTNIGATHVNFNRDHDITREHLGTAYNTQPIVLTDLLVHMRWVSSPDTSRVPQSSRGLGEIYKTFTRLRGTT